MGSQVKAVCKCSYNKELLVGGGKLTYKTIEYFPCFCEECQEIVALFTFIGSSLCF